jgi:hypothetical protein
VVSCWSIDYLADVAVLVGRNCEDILMSLLMTSHTKKAPLLFKAAFRDRGKVGISSDPEHYRSRTECVQHFLSQMNENVLVDETFYLRRYGG